MPRLSLPTIAQLAQELYWYAHDLAHDYDPADIADENGEPCGDVRLQADEDGWAVHTGDASYDQDHRGYWGAGCVAAGASLADCRNEARELLAQVRDDYATRNA